MVVNNMMSMLDGDEQPTLSQVETTVDLFLNNPLAQSLLPRREELITTFLERTDVRIEAASVLENESDHDPWLPDTDTSDWRLWNRLSEYLKISDGLPARVVDELDSSTDETLGRLESPKKDAKFDRRGMVVGHVQSGKTTHYTALAAKAFDAGYRIVIVLAGMHKDLRSQTHARIDTHLLGRDSRLLRDSSSQQRSIGVAAFQAQQGLKEPDFQVITCTNAADNGDFNRSQASQFYFKVNDTTRMVMVVKKNYSVLRSLRNWLQEVMNESRSGNADRIKHPTLLIDDEADQASMNTKDEDNSPSTINGLIRELLTSFDRVGFVGYTATPFANVFADPDATSGGSDPKFGEDLFPKSFIVNLQAPSNYIGPDVVFGHPGDESVNIPERPPLPMHVEVTDTNDWLPAKHKKTFQPGPLPATVKQAIKLFVLNCATRCCRGDKAVHNSMLVHGTRFVATQRRVTEQVQEYVATIRTQIQHAGEETRAAALSSLKSIWMKEIEEKHPAFRQRLGDSVAQLPEWNRVEEIIPYALKKIQVMQINGESDDALAYSDNRKEGLWVIAIGGDKLSRGLTLEGLSVSYFLRTSKAFDTLMQMGRWFGYRPRYVDLCRVYTQLDLVYAFREIALVTEELRADFTRLSRSNREPKDFGMRVRTPSDGLMITARNKLRRGEAVKVRYAGELVQALEMPCVGDAAESNRRALSSLIRSLGEPCGKVRGKEVPWKIWKNVPATEVLSFLESYQATRTHSFLNQCEQLREYIQDRVDKAGELTNWTVCLMSKKGPAVQIAGHSIGLLKRKRDDNSHPSDYFTRAVVGSAEEAADLSKAELASAVQRTPKQLRRTSTSGEEIGSRESVRQAREPSGRGLLLLYPIHLVEKNPKGFVDLRNTSLSATASQLPHICDRKAADLYRQRSMVKRFWCS